VTVARLTMDAIRACEAARSAIQKAMGTANQLSVVVLGWPTMQQADWALARLVDPHGQVRAIAENEIRAGGTP
jgi:hypothetical protein